MNSRMEKSKILVTCAKGITPFLKEELSRIRMVSLPNQGFPIISESVAGIETEGTMDDTLRLNLLLRTGHRVLFLLRKFYAENADELYQKGSNIAWEEYIAGDGYFSVSSSVDNPTINTPLFANLKLKDAIADRIRKKSGQRPDSGPEQNRAVVNLYWKNNDCSIYLDTSGEPLSKRNYRKIPMNAPMQETLAAAVISATAWNGSGHFINPMCGSGTLAIEAALAGLNRASGILRYNFGFMHLKGYNASIWNDLREQAKKESKKTLDCRIIATDISKDAIEAAKNNAATAGVEHLIEFDVCDYSDTPIPDGSGIVILNPGYGERMGNGEELESVYKGIGDFFKQKCKGYTGYIFTGNLDLAKKVGLKAKRRVPFFNGPIDCRLLEYELYEGSRKVKS